MTRSISNELTQERLDRLLLGFDPDREKAGERYERIRQKLIRFFAVYRFPDPAALADETLNRVARKLETGDRGQATGDNSQHSALSTQHSEEAGAGLETYIYGVAKNVVHEQHRRQERHRTASLEDLPNADLPAETPAPDASAEEDRLQNEQARDCLRHCLDGLTPDKRAMILRYYQGEGEGEAKRRRGRLARELGIGIGPLRSRALRVRETLLRCVNQCTEAAAAE